MYSLELNRYGCCSVPDVCSAEVELVHDHHRIATSTSPPLDLSREDGQLPATLVQSSQAVWDWIYSYSLEYTRTGQLLSLV